MSISISPVYWSGDRKVSTHHKFRWKTKQISDSPSGSWNCRANGIPTHTHTHSHTRDTLVVVVFWVRVSNILGYGNTWHLTRLIWSTIWLDERQLRYTRLLIWYTRLPGDDHLLARWWQRRQLTTQTAEAAITLFVMIADQLNFLVPFFLLVLRDLSLHIETTER